MSLHGTPTLTAWCLSQCTYHVDCGSDRREHACGICPHASYSSSHFRRNYRVVLHSLGLGTIVYVCTSSGGAHTTSHSSSVCREVARVRLYYYCGGSTSTSLFDSKRHSGRQVLYAYVTTADLSTSPYVVVAEETYVVRENLHSGNLRGNSSDLSGAASRCPPVCGSLRMWNKLTSFDLCRSTYVCTYVYTYLPT